MRFMATYDLMESMRNTNEWMGATARAMASYPAFSLSMNPMLTLTAAWGEVTERTFARMVTKPDWGIRSIVGPEGQDHLVDVKTIVDKPPRVPIVEIMTFNPTVRKLVMEEMDEKLFAAIRIGKSEGMQLFNDSLYDFVTREFVSREAAFEISPNIEELKMKLKGIEVKGSAIL